MTLQRARTTAPYFCLTRAAWIPYAFTWEGPRGCDSYREAEEASRFLVAATRLGVG